MSSICRVRSRCPKLKIDPAPVSSRPHPQYYGRPPLHDTILLPDQAQLPGRKYLDWHKANIFAA